MGCRCLGHTGDIQRTIVNKSLVRYDCGGYGVAVVVTAVAVAARKPSLFSTGSFAARASDLPE